MKIIETQRLILRTWVDADIRAFFEMNQDPKVTEFLNGPMSQLEVETFIKNQNMDFDEQGYTLFAVEIKENAEFIGFIGLKYRSKKDFDTHFAPSTEIGWRIASKHWNKGYATEGAKAVLEYGFIKCKLKEIVSFTVPMNIASIRVMEKIGMQHDLKGDFKHPKLPLDHKLSHHVLYRLSAADYR